MFYILCFFFLFLYCTFDVEYLPHNIKNEQNEEIDNYIFDDNTFYKNIIFLKKNMYYNNCFNEYSLEYKSISEIDEALLYYKNIHIDEYCYVQVFFKKNINDKTSIYYRKDKNYNFNEKLNLVIKMIELKDNNKIITKILLILKSILYRLNKI